MFLSRANFVSGIILRLKWKVILIKAISYFSGSFSIGTLE